MESMGPSWYGVSNGHWWRRQRRKRPHIFQQKSAHNISHSNCHSRPNSWNINYVILVFSLSLSQLIYTWITPHFRSHYIQTLLLLRFCFSLFFLFFMQLFDDLFFISIHLYFFSSASIQSHLNRMSFIVQAKKRKKIDEPMWNKEVEKRCEGIYLAVIIVIELHNFNDWKFPDSVLFAITHTHVLGQWHSIKWCKKSNKWPYDFVGDFFCFFFFHWSRSEVSRREWFEFSSASVINCKFDWMNNEEKKKISQNAKGKKVYAKKERGEEKKQTMHVIRMKFVESIDISVSKISVSVV